MIKVRDIVSAIDSVSKKSYSCEWDNKDFFIGDMDKKVEKILLTYEIDEYSVNEGIEKGAEMILSHHPLIFNPIKKISFNDYTEKAVYMLINAGLSAYSAHTSLDACKTGLNDILAKRLGLVNITTFHGEGERKYEDEGVSLGRIGEYKEGKKLSSVLSFIRDEFSLDSVRYTGDEGKNIFKVAVLAGGGGSMIGEAIKAGADLYISGEFKEKHFKEAHFSDIAAIDVTHFGSEIQAIDWFYDLLKGKFGDKLVLIKSNTNRDYTKTFLG